MNEIRMYVEHLFEGRVLTAENIELKEEIYGNLVARYEDYIAGGMDVDEALRKTKESMTSIDDVLEGCDIIEGADDSATSGSGAADSAEAVDKTVAMPVAGTPAPPAVLGDAADVNADEKPGDASEPDAAVDEKPEDASEPDGSVERPEDASEAGGTVGERLEDAGEPDGKMRRARAIIIASVVGIAACVVLGLGFMYALGAIDRAEVHTDGVASEVQEGGQSNASSSQQGGQTNGKQDASQSGGSTGNGASARNKEVVVDADGTVWVDGERGDDIAVAVVNAQPGDISMFQDTDPSDASNVESLLHLLPMAAWVTDVDVTLGVDVLGLAYREVPDGYEGDSIDLALSYNTMALFCSMPLLNEVRVTVTESEDPMDEEYYVFTRENAQRCFGVLLSGDLMNEAGWHQLKEDNLYSRKFAERMVDMAEREWM